MHNTIKFRTGYWLYTLILLILTACGGGGKGDSDNANLSGLVISVSNLSPAFESSKTSYSASVDVLELETTVTATAEDSKISQILINGTEVSSGVASDFINLNEGDNDIDVEVTAEDEETTKTYTITVNRGAVVNNHTAQHVVFIADRDTDEVFELYSVLDDGASAPIKLSGTMVDGGDVSQFKISPNGAQVAYMADQDQNSLPELYVVPIDGSSPVVKVVPNSFTRNFKSFAWSPDSSQLLYLGGFNDRDVDELFVVDSDGNNSQLVNGSVGTTAEIGDYAWSPDGSFVAYKVFNRDAPSEVIGVNSHQVGTSSGDPGFSIRISATLAPPQVIDSFTWSPNSTTVAYLADQDTSGILEVYVATAGVTNSSNKISAAVTGESVSSYAWSPDGDYMAYIGDTSARSTLYRSTADLISLGSRRSQDADLDIPSFAWSPDSSKMAYRAKSKASTTSSYELFWSAPADPMANGTAFSSDFNAGGNVKRYQWSPDGSAIAYLADQDTDELFELYVSTADGSVTSDKLSGSLATDGDVQAFAWSPDSSQIAFRAESEAAGVSALFTSLADGSRIATRISQTNLPDGNDTGVFTFDWANDSEALTYHGAETADAQLELYTGLANGHIRGYVISGSMVDDGDAQSPYAYNDSFLSRETYHDQITELFRNGSWISPERADLCGMAYHESTDSLFISRCAGSFEDHNILRYSFETDVLEEVHRYPSQNDYGMRIAGDDLVIVRTYDESILRLTDLDRPRLTVVDDYLAGLSLTEMNEKYDIAIFDDDYYLVAGNALTSDQHNGIHVLEEPNYNAVTELVSDVVANWPNESFGYSRSIVHVNNALDNFLVVATGSGGDLERWDTNGVFQNRVTGFGSSYLQTDSSDRVYAASTNRDNSAINRWTFDLTGQETFNFSSELNSGESMRFILRETSADIEVYLASFRDNDLRIDMTTVPQ